MTRTPIPAALEHRPTIGGLVCPWINVELADGGVDFRAHHDTRSQQSFTDGICQVCAEPITAPFVFLGGPNQLRTLSFDEPPLHPVCAHYTSNACPMVTGKPEHYATHNPLAAGHRGHRCPDVGCDCGGWIPTPGLPQPAGGDPTHEWFAVYADRYQLGIDPNHPNRVACAVIHPDAVRAIRHISSPGTGRTWRRIPNQLDDYTPPTTQEPRP